MVKQFINGEFVDGAGKLMQVINPADDSVVDEFKAATAEQANEALESAQKAFKTWRNTSLNYRIDLLLKLADAMEENRDYIVDLESKESGKPYGEADGDLSFAIQVLHFHAEEARRVYGTTLPDYSGERGSVYHIVEKRPVGVVVGHLAWNYPMYNMALKVGPVVGSGCTCVLKPSAQTPLATLFVASLAKKVGFPAGVINVVCGPSDELGRALNSSTIPALIGLIGSTETALQVMADAATSVKRFSFELGGRAPAIIMEDADLDLVADTVVSMKMSNSGQMCVDFNRVYIHESIYDKLCDMMLERLKKWHVGKGADKGQIIGPMINKSAQKRMCELVEDAVSKGGKLLWGGKIPEGYSKGCYFEPTMIKDATEDMRVFKEEIFGPILAVCKYSDLDDVLHKASDCDSGLSSYVYGHDSRKLAKCFEALEYGEVLVNVDGLGDVTFLPHCGIKNSGLGCDNSKWSLEEYFDFRRIKLIP